MKFSNNSFSSKCPKHHNWNILEHTRCLTLTQELDTLFGVWLYTALYCMLALMAAPRRLFSALWHWRKANLANCCEYLYLALSIVLQYHFIVVLLRINWPVNTLIIIEQVEQYYKAQQDDLARYNIYIIMPPCNIAYYSDTVTA